ncbi:hypothetical protein M427DRAFT_309316 [Gonapodya prolifera JEL478]|uniref:Signal recognition particle subunit SRP68 n=1 Tax=Gonapodya prolifera (strain JEL478) TaxID=1344416 RepID=A0A139AGK0_GONPJ|nr:hypothetical protein M427DRAFT_309316 [Gonapodya prolifera JEL478]|eukprot:KXS15819.1 hypothetical protein M427DRAFT_309316 [Gonapodya prolifera JEL478]
MAPASDSELETGDVSNSNPQDTRDAAKEVKDKGTPFDPLTLTHDARNMYGLRHQDYERYRHYCTRRVAHLRKLLNITQVTGTNRQNRRFVRKAITPELVLDSRHLHVALFDAERAWAYAMELKEGTKENPRKRHHLMGRLKRAVEHAGLVNEMCEYVLANPPPPPEPEPTPELALDPSKPLPPSLLKLRAQQKSRRVPARVDELSVSDAKAYAATMKGILAVERRDWRMGAESLEKARSAYASIIQSPQCTSQRRSLAHAAIDTLSPQLRFCAYNLRLTSGSSEEDLSELVAVLRDSAGAAGLEGLQGAAEKELEKAMQGKGETAKAEKIAWRAKKTEIANPKVAAIVVRARQADEALDGVKATSGDEEGGRVKLIQEYDRVLETWWEAQREADRDVREDESTSKAQPGVELTPRAASLRVVASYTAYRRLMHTIDRNIVLAADVEEKLASSSDPEAPTGSKEGKKGKRAKLKKDVPKREDVARLWDGVVQSLSEIQELFAVQADPALLVIVSSQASLARAQKCLHLALAQNSPVPAFALMSRSLQHISTARTEAEQSLRRVGRLPTAAEDGAELKRIVEESKALESRVGSEKVAVRARWVSESKVVENQVPKGSVVVS